MAVWTTSAALPLIVVGGAGGGSSGGAPYSPRPRPPPSPSPSEGHSEHGTHSAARVVARIPEPTRPAILEPIAYLRSQRQPCQRPPLDATAHTPLGGELLRPAVGGQAERQAGERIGSERGAAAARLDLVPEPVEGASPAERVVHEHRRPEPARERPSQRGCGPKLVDVGAIAVVPAPEMELQPAAAHLCPERDGEHEERREPPGLSQPRQRRGAPPTCVGPCDGTRGAGPGA